MILRMVLIPHATMAGKFESIPRSFEATQLMFLDRDNEKPAREAKVHAFQAQGRAITNEEVCQLDY